MTRDEHAQRPHEDVERAVGTAVHVTTVDLSLRHLLLGQLVGLREAGWRVIGMSADGPDVEVLRHHGIEHVALAHSTRAMDPVADIRAARELYGHLRRLRPDVLHTHTPKPGVYGRVVGRLARVPLVVNTVHGLWAQPEDPWPRRAVVYTLERLAAACSDAELVQNPDDVATLRRLRVPTRKLQLLGNGIDLDRFDPARFDDDHRATVRASWGVGADDVVIGAVGRLVREKGYPELLEAFARVRAARPTARLVIAGPHDPEKPDAIPAAELAAEGVVILGMVDPVEQVYPGFDVYVLASHREGWPRSAMEAAAFGLSVVATDIRGCREVVDHDRTGLLVPVRSPAALADALLALVADADRRRRLGAGSRAKALSDFDDQHQVEMLLRTYARARSTSS